MSLAHIDKTVRKGSVEDELVHRIDFERLPAPRRHHHGWQRTLGART